MSKRGLWSLEEKEKLKEYINGNHDYNRLAEELGRSLWAVECQVIKAVRESDDDPLEYGISIEKITKYDSANRNKDKRKELEIDEKQLHLRTLRSLLDLTDTISRITARLDIIEEKLTMRI